MPAPSLGRRIAIGLCQLFIGVAVILCLSAWSLSYWQGWAFLLTFGVCCAAMSTYLLYYDPALLQRRMASGPTSEREPRQKLIQAINGLAFGGLLMLPGLDHRFGWSHMSSMVVLFGHALIVAGFVGCIFVFRENSFASSIIEVAPNQPVIATGLYAWVRHPMYAAAVPMLLGIPLALGSYWAVLIMGILVPALIARLLDEERFLDVHLPGYLDYRHRVVWRLIPGLW